MWTAGPRKDGLLRERYPYVDPSSGPMIHHAWLRKVLKGNVCRIEIHLIFIQMHTVHCFCLEMLLSKILCFICNEL